MAAAVSNAGGLGVITGLNDKPFGVNLTFLPSVTPPDYPGFIKALIDSGVKRWRPPATICKPICRR